MYKLYFAKVFKEDISKSIKYIRETLNAPLAAEKMKTLRLISFICYNYPKYCSV